MEKSESKPKLFIYIGVGIVSVGIVSIAIPYINIFFLLLYYPLNSLVQSSTSYYTPGIGQNPGVIILLYLIGTFFTGILYGVIAYAIVRRFRKTHKKSDSLDRDNL